MKPVRAYLLGTLEPAEAAAFEDRYFADDAVFAELKDAEDRLIADFLAGRLSPRDQKLFEARYLRVPELRLKLDAARAGSKPAARRQFGLAWAAAAAALLVVAAGAIWYSRDAGQPGPVLIARSEGSTGITPLDVHLVPFLPKGASGTANRFNEPPPRTPLRLTLEFPGRSETIEGTVHIQRLEISGGRKPVWNSSTSARSTTVATGQQLAVLMPADLLVHADYFLEVTAPDGNLLGSYYFRVSEAR